jgi:hypothetical protein
VVQGGPIHVGLETVPRPGQRGTRDNNQPIVKRYIVPLPRVFFPLRRCPTCLALCPAELSRAFALNYLHHTPVSTCIYRLPYMDLRPCLRSALPFTRTPRVARRHGARKGPVQNT